MVEAHDQAFTHHYVIHYPDHQPRADDPHYKDFDHYHREHRADARCYVGKYTGFVNCKDAQGAPAPGPPVGEMQRGLELHHAEVEFALLNSVDLKAFEFDYPGISDREQLGAWVESGKNFMWLCAFHHRGAGGAHTASASDWGAEKYIRGLIS